MTLVEPDFLPPSHNWHDDCFGRGGPNPTFLIESRLAGFLEADMSVGDALLGIHATALQLRSQRMSMLASNIANAATPDTGSRHQFCAGLAPGKQRRVHRVFGRISGALQPSLDGNTVEMSTEQTAFAENALAYRSSLSFLQRSGRDDDARAEGRIECQNQTLSLFDISGRAMAAQLVRLNTTASNLANAGTISGTEEGAFRSLKPVFRTIMGDDGTATVAIDKIVSSPAAPTKRHDPSHPLADKNGDVWEAAVDSAAEMVEMLETSRQYQNNVQVLQTAKGLMLETLRLGQ
ncbi:MAG: flagellar basal body rod protein FlgC [Sphingomonadales bacterium]|nr:flagellar basal body rod protein FlgC [Sphingomonadales bacterium]